MWLTRSTAYNAFMRYGQRDKQWCGNHRINQKALLRAVSIRKQLKKYLERFGMPIVSCEGDAVRLRKCLVSGYFKVSPDNPTSVLKFYLGEPQADRVERCENATGRNVSFSTRGCCPACSS